MKSEKPRVRPLVPRTTEAGPEINDLTMVGDHVGRSWLKDVHNDLIIILELKRRYEVASADKLSLMLNMQILTRGYSAHSPRS